MTRSRLRHPVGMADAVAETLKRLGVEARVHQGEIWRIWPKVVGSQIARHAQPQSVLHGRLIIHVTDSVWLHHLSMMRRQILTAINAGCGSQSFRELVLRVGEVSSQPEVPSGNPEIEDEASLPDPASVSDIDGLLTSLRDAPFHATLRRLLLRSARTSAESKPHEEPR